MSLDFSFFLNQSTLIFFLLLFVILIIFSITCFFVIKAIFKFIKSLFKKKPKEFEMKTVMSDKGEDLEVNVEQLEKSKEETAKIQKQTQQTFNVKYTQPIADNETKTPDKEPEKSSEAKQQWSDKEKQDIDAGLGKLKGEEGAGEKKSFLERQSMGENSPAKPKISIPVSKKLGKEEASQSVGAEKPTPTANVKYTQPTTSKETKISEKEPEKSSEAKQQWSDKEKQDIDADLGKLKGEEGAGEKKSFLERQSMGENSPAKPKISIPVSKKLGKEEILQLSRERRLIDETKVNRELKIEELKREINNPSENKKIGTIKNPSSVLEYLKIFLRIKKKEKKSIDEDNFHKKFDKPEFMKDEVNLLFKSTARKKLLKESQKAMSEGRQPYENFSGSNKKFLKQEARKSEKSGKVQVNDSSIFGGKEEISRSELRTKLFGDASVAKAQRELYMNLSPVERAKLEKSVFKSSYGLNISKTDLKANLKKMGREWASTSDIKKKETLRKQIKFFKKIGGIK